MHARNLSAELESREWSVTIITLESLPLIARYLPHLTGALVNMVAPPLGFYYKGLITRVLYKYLLRYRSSDLLIFEDIYIGWKSHIPSISVLHAVWSDNLQSYDFTEKQIDTLRYKEVTLINSLSHPVITVSKPYKRFLEQVHFRNVELIDLQVVELGLDETAIRARQKEPSDWTNRSLVYCGSLEARKNVYFMLDVFRHVLGEDPTASLTIVGDGPDREGLEKYATQHILNVTFLGRLPHEQVLNELAKHNIYIHTALKESFSFALLEAKLAGLTTCALASLEVPEEFVDLRFDEFDAAAWCSRILGVHAKPDLTDFPDYSIKRMTDHTLSLVSLN